MNYTKEQFETLSQWEANFAQAREGRWARNPGRSALAVINDALNAATGVKHRLNAWCQQCILNLLQKAGKLYFEDKAEMEAAKVPECPVPEPEFDPAPPTPAPKKKAATTAKKTADKKTSTSKAKAAKTEK